MSRGRGIVMFRSVAAEDVHAHEPEDADDERWQESFCIVWHDPVTRSGGNHHFSLWRNKGIADVWSWVIVDGVEVAREQAHDLDVPQGDLTDIQAGGMHVSSGDDLVNYRLRHTFGATVVDISYSAYSPPVELDYQHSGALLGKRHYETLGRVDVVIGGDQPERHLSGVAFQDHSWGPRELLRNPAGQFFFAVFGDDLMMAMYSRVTVEGVGQDGWLYEPGRLQRLARVEISASVADDGLLPVHCDCTLWTDDRRGRRIRGTAQAATVEGGIGLLAGDALTVFECGGRLGGGMLEIKPLRFTLPAHSRILGLPE